MDGSLKIPMLKPKFNYFNTFSSYLKFTIFCEISGIFFAAFLCIFMSKIMNGIKWYEISRIDPLKSLCKRQNSIILIIFLVILNFQNFVNIRGIFFAGFLWIFMSKIMRWIKWYEMSTMGPLKSLCKSQNSIILVLFLVIFKFN